MHKRVFSVFLCLWLALMALGAPVRAAGNAPQYVTAETALVIAQAWANTILAGQGSWGGAAQAQAGQPQEMRRGARLLGYYIPILPQGYVLVPLRTELAPVKAYSDTGKVDIASDTGLADLLKIGLERPLNAIETRAGPVAQAATADVLPLLEVSYNSLWQALADPLGPQAPLNYASGGVMTPTSWDQGDPYWDNDPAGDGGTTVVGCSPSSSNGDAILRTQPPMLQRDALLSDFNCNLRKRATWRGCARRWRLK